MCVCSSTVLQGNTPDDPTEWADQLFRKKDRDGSMSLSFDEFRATIRRYGKIPPRESNYTSNQPELRVICGCIF